MLYFAHIFLFNFGFIGACIRSRKPATIAVRRPTVVRKLRTCKMNYGLQWIARDEQGWAGPAGWFDKCKEKVGFDSPSSPPPPTKFGLPRRRHGRRRGRRLHCNAIAVIHPPAAGDVGRGDRARVCGTYMDGWGRGERGARLPQTAISPPRHHCRRLRPLLSSVLPVVDNGEEERARERGDRHREKELARPFRRLCRRPAPARTRTSVFLLVLLLLLAL